MSHGALETFDPSRLVAAGPHAISDALENGRIAYFPQCPVPLPDSDDLQLLREKLPGELKRKNVSYHPEARQVRGLKKNATLRPLAHDVLTRHSMAVTEFLELVMPDLFAGARIGTSSFRPIEERGRNLKPHASNELVHVDAGAYGATNGDRILRFFVNVNPELDRVWATKGSFPNVFSRYGEQAQLHEMIRRTGGLSKGPADRARSALLRGLGRLGVPLATVLDSSPYDRVMRRFHNFMKDTPAFQSSAVGHQEIRFPPFSAWMVFTDGVSHACLSGQHAFIWTCLIPLENCRHPDLAPFNILEKAA
ncbi:MAG: Kdo hydroxylase family protein [Gammaproteobacteria bacterium]